MDSTTATITILSLTPIHAGQVLALADVSVVIDGLDIVICGVQVRANAKQSSIHLPCYRAPDGQWKSAIILPDEVKDAMGDIVQQAALDAGILQRATVPA